MEAAAIEAIVTGRHRDPFAVLGVHCVDGVWQARAFLPGAETVEAADLSGRPLGSLTRLHPAGLFAGPIDTAEALVPIYRATAGAHRWDQVDVYAFAPVLGDIDDYLSAEGSHLRLYERLGAHPMQHQGVTGVHFAVWAPDAARIALVGDFNDWDGRRHVMRRRAGSGLFEIFIPDIGPGRLYKYEIQSAAGRLQPLKADPVGFAAELRPGTASRVGDPAPHAWHDGDWLAARRQRDPRSTPMSIYEVHAGSWRRHGDGRWLTYDELADQLLPYVVEQGFTHVEFLPLSEHPLDESWGYQPVGLYAPTARYGDPAGLKRLIDRAHQAGIGIILDWVPAHFPTDAHGLHRFDGTALYEHADPRLGHHPDWNTAIYNYGRLEVANYLINNALYWAREFHVDGLRVDAVASMLYLDYSRKQGEWLPNREGGNRNLDAIAFLRRLNDVISAEAPDVLMIAEESTAFPGVTHAVAEGGLGFRFKWNMGFMNDTLRYMARDPVHRRHHHDEWTFGLTYAFSECFVLPLSHDEVVHGKGALLSKMSGDDWQKFASLRAYYATMWGYPGKKLLFMGQEFAQRREWSEARELDWHLLDAPTHGGVQRLVADLNRLYCETPALHVGDSRQDGFQWLIVDDKAQSVLAFLRRDNDGRRPAVIIANFTPQPRENYRVPLPKGGRWREAINTDSTIYGGSGLGNLGAISAEAHPSHGFAFSASVWIPPLATLIFIADEGG